MWIDVAAAAVVFVWAVFGYRKGFIRQLIGLLAIVCVVLFASPAADIAARVLADEADIAVPGARMRVLLVSACGAVIFVALSLTGMFLHRTLVKGIKPAEKTDRVLGMSLAVVQAVIAVYAVLCLCALGREKIDKYIPEFGAILDASMSYPSAASFNAFENSPFLRREHAGG